MFLISFSPIMVNFQSKMTLTMKVGKYSPVLFNIILIASLTFLQHAHTIFSEVRVR